ncbi:hypothetical protein [Anaeromassilibacillus senegalensis]|uniref:hypothetical protein n=1 Tax=Anaeromassilibacillus senegalensis TaxID=1673717 RepID=UPI000682C6B6|nr:hypothetical protein [Anaeromassilibacillus senegalensis]
MKLLEQVFTIINDSGLNYCIQNKYEMMPEEIPSDIDMMYKDADEKFLDALIIKIAKETKLLVTQKILQGFYEYTYILTPATPTERFQLQLDFYRAISRKDFPNVMPAEDMLENRRFYKCFYVPDYFDELKYMWIRRTIKHDMNEEHLQIARDLFQREPERYSEKLRLVFGEEASTLILNILHSGNVKDFYQNYEVFQRSVRKISDQNYHLKTRISNWAFQVGKVIPKRVFYTSGISVAFLSPDGGGKSTVISSVSKTVCGSFYGIEQIYFRPHLLKNLGHYNPLHPSDEAESNPDPHGKELNNPLKSMLRYFYYNMDYLLGTWCKVLPLKIRKKLVLFDRYYYDYYVDLKRYQYRLPKWFPKAFAWSIPKPNLVFILDAPAEVLYERKQELPLNELARQRLEYQKVAKSLPNAHLIDATKPVEEVTGEITEIILNYKAHQTAKLLRCKVDEQGYLQ